MNETQEPIEVYGLMTTRDLAQKLGLSVSCLMQYRMRGTGPNYIKINRAVRYRPADVNAWLATKRHG